MFCYTSLKQIIFRSTDKATTDALYTEGNMFSNMLWISQVKNK